MIGAICGDVIGSIYEGASSPGRDFPLLGPGSRFTDDTVLTVAIADALRNERPYAIALRDWGRRYPDAGYGGWFLRWLLSDTAGPYHSFGNGSAMRVSPIGWALGDLDAVLREAAASAAVTHDHPEGIKGAQAVAAAVLLGRTGHDKPAMRRLLSERFGYACDVPFEDLQQRGGFDVTCQGTVPAAAAAFASSTNYEDAVRNAVSLGGDADTLACIAGALAEAHYGAVPKRIRDAVWERLDDDVREEISAFASFCGTP